MKTFAILLVLFGLRYSVLAQGGSSASQILTIEVKPITKISVSGNPGALIVTEAIPGVDFSSISDENSNYSMTTNLENMKIVASINAPMSQGTRLMINLNSSKGISAGTVDISNALTPVNVVTGITRTNDQNQTIKYVFAADVRIGEIEAGFRTITLTLTD